MLSAEHPVVGGQLALYASNPQDWNPWAEAALSCVNADRKSDSSADYRVIGVVDDVRYFALERDTGQEMYMLLAQTGDCQTVDLVVRSAVLPGTLIPDIRAALRRADPGLPELLAALNHPHIAQIFGFEKVDGASALAMELVEGETLADRIANGAIPLDEAISIARQIADALAAAHEQGIIHRDLKPANVRHSW
jgi:serine/threonine protein kinase